MKTAPNQPSVSRAASRSKSLTGTGAALLILGLLAGVAAAAELGSPPSRTGKLAIGWGSADLTPPQPVALCGQFNRRISTRVNDPLTVTALALETRDDRGVLDQALLVSADVVCIRRVDLQRVRALVKPRVPDLDPAKIAKYRIA